MEAKSLVIEVGRRVYDSGVCGMVYGTVYAVYGEPGRIKVERMAGGVMVMGGSCAVDIVMDNGRLVSRLPEAILLSLPWKLIDEVVDAEKIAEGLALAACKAAERKAMEEPEGAVIAAVAIVEGSGYKLMDESMNPYYYDCPAKILDMLTPAPEAWPPQLAEWSATWRARCRERLEMGAAS